MPIFSHGHEHTFLDGTTILWHTHRHKHPNQKIKEHSHSHKHGLQNEMEYLKAIKNKK